jgi:hypothetical protein
MGKPGIEQAMREVVDYRGIHLSRAVMGGMGRMQPIASLPAGARQTEAAGEIGKHEVRRVVAYSHGRSSPAPRARRHGSRYTRRAFCAPISSATLTASPSDQSPDSTHPPSTRAVARRHSSAPR